jgi:hypothetical protein
MKRLSIKDVSEQLYSEDEKLSYGQFLDDFYHEESSEGRYNLIKDEPNFINDKEIFMCILAGTAQKLANDYFLDIPKWVFDEKYILKKAYYTLNTKNPKFQEYLRETTPLEYKSRNLFVGETILDRC